MVIRHLSTEQQLYVQNRKEKELLIMGEKIQSALNRIQNPNNCSNSRILVCKVSRLNIELDKTRQIPRFSAFFQYRSRFFHSRSRTRYRNSRSISRRETILTQRNKNDTDSKKNRP
uniref:Uncharacterized protein n=1 Tax=Meloidogyne incognita TaxID=6306 RepID=A0A914KP73_MELIC